MASHLPSSRFHCPGGICSFRGVESAVTDDQRQLEEVGVITQLRELEEEPAVAGVLPSSKKILGAERVNAIRGCAAAIFHHECPWFFNEFDMTSESYQLIYTGPATEESTPEA